MADVSGRRREPKGIPTGGQFADEMGGAADASDLDRNNDPFEENGLENLPDKAKAMARIMAARGGDQVYRDLAKYNEAMGWGGTPTESEPILAAPSAFAGVTLTPATFSGLIAGGMRDFRGADLHGLDLTGYDLRGLNLDGVDLTDANLDKADLSEASLKGARLDGAKFTHVKADGIDLTGASMRKADLSHTVIQGSANLVDADLTGARLDGFTVSCSDSQDFVDASGIVMRNTVGTDVGFSPSLLNGGDFTDAHWNGGNALAMEDRSDCVLTNASFTNMTEFSLPGSCHGVNLSGSYYSFIDDTSDFSGADLRNTQFDDCILEPPLDLRGAKLEGAICYGLKGQTGIRTDRDPEGVEAFDPAVYGMRG